jgi:hypothetical protein
MRSMAMCTEDGIKGSKLEPPYIAYLAGWLLDGAGKVVQ